MKMNKTGGMSNTQVLLLVAVIIAGMIFVYPQLSTSGGLPSLPSSSGTETVQVTTSGSVDQGDTSTLEVRVYDRAQDSTTQVTVPMYYWRSGILATTTSDSVNSEDISATVGEAVKVIAFNGSYYGEAKTISLASKNQVSALDVNSIAEASDMVTKLYEDGSVVTEITLGTGEVASLDKLTLKLNTNNKQLNLKTICFDVATGTNVSSISLSGATVVNEPERLKDTVDYCFSAEAVLEEWDTYSSPIVEFEADDTNNPAEDITVYFIDEANYIGDDDALAKGVETDSDVDVGAGDITATITIA